MKIKSIFAGLILVLGSVFISGCIPKATPTVITSSQSSSEVEADFIITGIENVQKIAQITGKDSINHTDQYAVYGTDLGSMVEMDGKVYVVFGDTFSVRGAQDPATGGGGSKWRSNVIGVSSDNTPSDGLSFDTMITDSSGEAKELVISQKSYTEITAIPTGGFSIDGKLYLTFMSIKSWGQSGVWAANYGGIARSDDQGQTWVKLNQLKWMTTSNFTQACCVIKDDTLYIWSTPSGRFGGVKLMKVATDSVEEFDQYQYYAGLSAGKPIWSQAEEDAIEIIPANVGEMSVIWNEDLDRWIMTYINVVTPSQLVLREGITPWGPWGEPLVICTDKTYPMAYGSYMHSKFVENDGKKIYFNMSQWLPYNVFWMSMELVTK